jgi:hypothetical protein
MLFHFFLLPNLELQLDFHAENDDGDDENIFCLSSKNDILTIQEVIDVSFVNDPDLFDYYVVKFEAAIKKIKCVRTSQLFINPSGNKEYRKQRFFDIACFLSRTKLLTRTQIANLVQQAPE